MSYSYSRCSASSAAAAPGKTALLRGRGRRRMDSVGLLRTRTLGAGGPEVSVVGLGTNNFGGALDYEQSLAVVDAALDAGVTLLRHRGHLRRQGTSEESSARRSRDGATRSCSRRSSARRWTERPAERRGSRDYIRRAVEGSLRRLRTDVIDLYQHARARREHADRGDARRARRARARRARCARSARPTSRPRRSRRPSGSRASAGWRVRRGAERVLAARARRRGGASCRTCERLGIGMLPYFPLASGLLTGKYRARRAAAGGHAARGREIAGESAGTRSSALQRVRGRARDAPLESRSAGSRRSPPSRR